LIGAREVAEHAALQRAGFTFASRDAHHSASHNDLSESYERISRYYVGNLACLAGKLDSMPGGEGCSTTRV
jgi:hypothetical protein